MSAKDYSGVRPEALKRLEAAHTDDEAWAAIDDMTDAEVDLWLRREGIDPDVAWARMVKKLEAAGVWPPGRKP